MIPVETGSSPYQALTTAIISIFFPHSSLNLSVGVPARHTLPFVVELFAPAYAQLKFNSSVFEINLQRDQGITLSHDFALQLADLVPVKKQFSGPERIRIKNASLFIRTDVYPFSPDFTGPDLCPAFFQVDPTLTDAFDLRAGKNDTAFQLVLNKVIMIRFPVLSDHFETLLMRHSQSSQESISLTLSLFNQIIICYNFFEGVIPLRNLHDISASAREAFYQISVASFEKRNSVLIRLSELLKENSRAVFEANLEDLRSARQEGLPDPLLHRLTFAEDKLTQMVNGLHALSLLPDPINRTLSSCEITEGLQLYKVSCPIGVIGVIFESRPDALIQISSLCIKSGNTVLLKGGREALRTNQCLCALVRRALEEIGLPADTAQLLETREDVSLMLKEDTLIDLIIPRGSNSFVRYIMDNSRIPVLGHSDGICHIFVDRDADISLACNVITDSKTQYVSVCNALETLLVHRDIAPLLLPEAARQLMEKNVEIRGDEETRKIIDCIPASDNDWSTEYLDYILSIRIVSSLQEAVDHINRYGSHHTDCIISSDKNRASEFMKKVDSAGVYWNVSTRFADGFVYGLGAEVGIATGKLHARGPMGLEGLTTYKYKLIGSGQTMAEMKSGARHYTHRPLNGDCPL